MKNILCKLITFSVATIFVFEFIGCATSVTAINIGDHEEFYSKPKLSDSIIAIGKPDKEILDKIGNNKSVVLIGLTNSYMLFEGGDEINKIASSGLDSSRLISINPDDSQHLFIKNKHFWGTLVLSYTAIDSISDEDGSKLLNLGFSRLKIQSNIVYNKTIKIDGAVYPPLSLTANQLSQLKNHRPFNLYKSRDIEPPKNWGAIAILPLAVVTDIVLMPIELGLGLVQLFIYRH